MSTTIRSRLILVGIPLAVAAAALVLMITAARAAAPAGTEASFSAVSGAGDFNSILARRAISIPYGIADEIALQPGGALVTGHGVCPEASESHRVRVKVHQEGVPAPAVGFTGGSCPAGEEISWSAAAALPGPHRFEPGTAEVCAQAVILRERTDAITFRWCKSVQLVE